MLAVPLIPLVNGNQPTDFDALVTALQHFVDAQILEDVEWELAPKEEASIEPVA
jgi:hypothetical protein